MWSELRYRCGGKSECRRGFPKLALHVTSQCLVITFLMMSGMEESGHVSLYEGLQELKGRLPHVPETILTHFLSQVLFSSLFTLQGSVCFYEVWQGL